MERETLPRRFDDLWHDHRAHLLALASRMLGDPAAAEDVVQEAYGRLARLAPADRDAIDDPGGWLAVTVRRRCLDRIRSAAFRREVVAGPGSRAEPPDPADPADRVTLDDQVQAALAVVLDRLTPAERTAFVLHDVFQYPYDDIAEIVGRTPAACRQLASRARRTITENVDGPGRFRVESAEQRLVTERFIAACTTGDLGGLLAILDPDVDGVADVGGSVGVVTVTGPADVAAAALRFLGPGSATILLSLPADQEAGVVAVRDGRAVSLLALRVRHGRIRHIDGIIDPGKLAPIATALGL